MASLYGIGLGPGDPELITIKALNLIKRIPVICFICNKQGHSMALDIAKQHIGNAELHPIQIEMSHSLKEKESRYIQAANDIENYLEQGQDVAFLCLGDPLLYATFSKLLCHLSPTIHISVIPGINSIQAAAAKLAQPLTLANENLSIVSALSSEENIRANLKQANGLAILKVGQEWKKLLGLIKDSGRLSQATLCYRVGTAEEKFLPLSEMNDTYADYFTLIIVSPHAKYADY